MELPRERLAELGSRALTDAEVLAIVLGTGRSGEPVRTMAARLIDEANGVAGLAKLSCAELRRLVGLGPAKAARLAAAFELGARAHQPQSPNEPLQDSRTVFLRYGRQLSLLHTEQFWIVSTDAKNRPIASREVARGGRTSCQVDPAEVFRILIADSACGVVLLHNHPSGDPTPSPEDLSLTERLAHVGSLLEIRLLDHLIVGNGGYTSLRDADLWPSISAKSGTSKP